MQSDLWQDHSVNYSRQHSHFYRWVIYPVICVFLLTGIFLIMGKTEVVIRTKARVIPLETKKLQIPMEAKIKKNNLTENKKVRKGDLLLSFDITDLTIEKDRIEQENKHIGTQQGAISTFIDSMGKEKNLFQVEDEFGYSNQVNAFLAEKEETQQNHQQLLVNQQQQQEVYSKTYNQLTDQLTKLQTDKDQWDQVREAWVNQNALVGFPSEIMSKYDGWKSRLSTVSNKEKKQVKSNILDAIDDQLNGIKNQIDQLELEKGKLVPPHSSEHEINGLLTKNAQNKEHLISEAKQTSTNLNETMAQNDSKLKEIISQTEKSNLYAPSDGILHLAEKYKNFNDLPKGTLVAEIYPDNKNTRSSFTAQIPANEITHVKQGMLVHFKIDKKGVAEKSIDGRLSSISETSDLSSNGAFYRVEGYLKGDKHLISRYGLTGDLSLVVGKKTYWEKIKDILLNNS